MFTQLTAYRNFIVSGIIIVLIFGFYVYVHGLKGQIEDLRMKLNNSQVEAAMRKLENTRYKSITKIQTKQVEKLSTDKEKALKKLNAWKRRKPEVKYKTIIKIKKVHSDDCKDIKNVINSVRKLNFHSL